MKKTIDFFRKILAMIVNPRLILDFFKIKNLDRNYNRMMANERAIRWFALAIALVAVISIRYEPLENTGHMEEIQMPLVVRIDEEAYTYFGSEIPATVTVFLVGDPIQIGVVQNNLEIYLDLNGLEPGEEHSVFISNTNTSDRVNVRVEPQLISGIRVAPLITRDFNVEDIRLDIMPEPDINHRYVMEPTIEQEYITVRGPEVLLEQIAVISAVVSGNEIDLNLEMQTLTARLVAYDEAGSVITIDISPNELEVLIEIREHVREIDLEVDPTNVPGDVRIQRVTVDPETIEIWGLIELLESLTLPVNFQQLNGQGRKTVTLELPNGVYSDVEEVNVRIEFNTIGISPDD